MIYTKEDRYVVNIYITNLFIQAPIDRKPGEGNSRENKVSTGWYASTYGSIKYVPHVVYDKVNKVLYLKVFKAIYGVLQ